MPVIIAIAVFLLVALLVFMLGWTLDQHRAGNILGLCVISAVVLGFAAFQLSKPLSENESVLFTIAGLGLGALLPPAIIELFRHLSQGR